MGKECIDFHKNPIDIKYKTIGVIMVEKSMYQAVIAMKKQGISKNEASKRLGLDYRTVSRYYKMTEPEFKKYRNKLQIKTKVFDEYEQEILDLYSVNGNRKLNVAAVYDYLEEKCGKLPGTEKTLANYIHFIILIDKLTLNQHSRIYQQVAELPFGKQIQLDFGEYRLKNGNKLYIFAAVLSASRYKYVYFQDIPFRTISVILDLLDSFDYFGGIPEEIVIDQDLLMVVNENKGDVGYTKEFKSFLEEMSLKVYVCRKADPESKGKIENLIGYIKKNFLSVRDFADAQQANERVFQWLERRANGKISQATKQIPKEVIEEERKQLRPIRNSIFRKDSLQGREERTVDEKGYISYNTCSYLVPAKYKHKTLEIYIAEPTLFVFDPITEREITSYSISLIPGKKIVHRNFLREKERTSKELRQYVCEMFELESWKEFVTINFKQFSRYVRDQSIEAKKYFDNQAIDQTILESALKYCLENKTYSFSNLNDTYCYYKKHQPNNQNAEIFKANSNLDKTQELKIIKPFKVEVQKSDIAVYKILLEQNQKEAT